MNKKTPPFKSAGKNTAAHRRRQLLIVKKYAQMRYGKYPNVLGVALGTKFVRRKRLRDIGCIQFFVTRKEKQAMLARHHKLPQFLYARSSNGKINTRKKIPVDVIPVGRIHASCGAGSQLDSYTQHGLITLIFTNKSDPARPCFLLSCAHVAGDINRSPPPNNELTSNCSTADPFAQTVVNSTANQGEMQFDIALAQIADTALPLPELAILNQTTVLSGFFPAPSIQQGTWVDCVLRYTSPRGIVDSLDGSATIMYGSQEILVHHLFGVNLKAQKGDSGGLVHQDSQAVGIVVAASPGGWLWFQPLEPAFASLRRISPIPIDVFGS